MALPTHAIDALVRYACANVKIWCHLTRDKQCSAPRAQLNDDCKPPSAIASPLPSFTRQKKKEKCGIVVLKQKVQDDFREQHNE